MRKRCLHGTWNGFSRCRRCCCFFCFVFFSLCFLSFTTSLWVTLSFPECLRSVWDFFFFPAYLSIPLHLIWLWFDRCTLHCCHHRRRRLWSFFYSTKKKKNEKKHLQHFYFGETSQLSVSHFQNRVRERYRRIIVRSDNVSAFLRLDQCFESSYENIVPLSVSMECFLTA